jgi:hypothetical protein
MGTLTALTSSIRFHDLSQLLGITHGTIDKRNIVGPPDPVDVIVFESWSNPGLLSGPCAAAAWSGYRTPKPPVDKGNASVFRRAEFKKLVQESGSVSV